MFARCPQQYAHRYVWKSPIPEQPLDLYMTCGSVVHTLLEHAHLAALGNKPVTQENLLESLPGLWEQTLKESPIPISPEEALPFVQKSIANVEWYFQTHFEAEKKVTIDVEKRIMYPLNPGRKQWLMGFLDRVSKPQDRKLVVHDYKTGALTLSSKTLGNDFQATLYGAMAAHQYAPLQEVELQWHYLSHGKTVTTLLEPENAREAVGKAQHIADGIESHKQVGLFPPKVGRHCGNCEFITMCPAHAQR